MNLWFTTIPLKSFSDKWMSDQFFYFCNLIALNVCFSIKWLADFCLKKQWNESRFNHEKQPYLPLLLDFKKSVMFLLKWKVTIGIPFYFTAPPSPLLNWFKVGDGMSPAGEGEGEGEGDALSSTFSISSLTIIQIM